MSSFCPTMRRFQSIFISSWGYMAAFTFTIPHAPHKDNSYPFLLSSDSFTPDELQKSSVIDLVLVLSCIFVSWHESRWLRMCPEWWLWGVTDDCGHHKLVAGRFENKKLTECECRLLSGSFKPDICPIFRAEMQSRAMPATKIKKRKALWCLATLPPVLLSVQMPDIVKGSSEWCPE